MAKSLPPCDGWIDVRDAGGALLFRLDAGRALISIKQPSRNLVQIVDLTGYGLTPAESGVDQTAD